jgi:hypothetical protein
VRLSRAQGTRLDASSDGVHHGESWQQSNELARHAVPNQRERRRSDPEPSRPSFRTKRCALPRRCRGALARQCHRPGSQQSRRDRRPSTAQSRQSCRKRRVFRRLAPERSALDCELSTAEDSVRGPVSPSGKVALEAPVPCGWRYAIIRIDGEVGYAPARDPTHPLAKRIAKRNPPAPIRQRKGAGHSKDARTPLSGTTFDRSNAVLTPWTRLEV